MNEIFLLLLEKVCEAIYFSLFFIVGKNLKKKRLLFIAIMIFEYIMLKHFIKYNVWFQIIYTFMSYVNLKVLYKEKAQVTDIFLFSIASIGLVIISILCGLVLFNNVNLYFPILILNRILMFGFIFLFKNKIYTMYSKMIKYWNRHKDPHKIRSLTLRNISIIAFNLMFYIINFCMLIGITFMEKR